MLRTGAVPDAARARAIETIERNATLQAKLVEDLLDASRIVIGKLQLELGEVDLARVVQAAVDSVALAAQAKAIVIAAKLPAPPGVAVRGDAARLQQVVWNLLTNAIKFTPRGGRVEVRLEDQQGIARVEVSDSGQGISPEFLPHVFERFRQADGTATRRHGGLGLGLAIVRNLVEAHGGSVRAESEGTGRGATFVVELPATAIRAPARASLLDNGEAGAMPSLAGIRVLLVDDQPDAVELAQSALSGAGADVQAARSAGEAMSVLSRWTPDVLVSDIGMPDVDGYTLIREVRALPPHAGGTIPAIALTAYVQADDRVRALSAGYQLHVPKPVDPRELALAVGNLVRAAPASRTRARAG
jgi:CheY-like chemotaxis protein/two-component sensor histidine kinase